MKGFVLAMSARLQRSLICAILSYSLPMAAAHALPDFLRTLAPQSDEIASTPTPPGPDAQLLAIYQHIARFEHKEALAAVDRLIQQQPNFRLAHLIRGDLLAARARPLRTLGDISPNNPTELGDLREEAVMRLRALREKPPVDAIPDVLLQLAPDQKTALVVDPEHARLYLYENIQGRPKFLADFYISVGKLGVDKLRQGDQKTPVGVYSITGHIPQAKLADLYGVGALPLNYPNEWDQRLGKTGHGIWLHGVPTNTYSRAPKASDGCVVLSNSDLLTLANYVQIASTPVILANQVTWLTPEQWSNARDNFDGVLETWRQDTESRELDKYVRHYSYRFQADGKTLTGWLDKRKVYLATPEQRTKLQIKNLSVLRYPGQQNMMQVTFDLETQTGNHSPETQRKRQYWADENGTWRIIYEGAALPASPQGI